MANTAENGTLLEARDITVSLGRSWRRKKVLNGVDFHIAAGEVVGIIGESGSGKTTLAKTLVGIHQHQAGHIQFDGKALPSTGKEKQVFRRTGSIQYIFQDPLLSLNPDRSIGWSVAEPLSASNRSDNQQVLRATTQAQLDHRLLERLPRDLSGGQRQRALIARALVTRPKLILADEPVSALDATVRGRILDVFRALAKEQRVGVVFISHDIGSIAGVTDRIVVMYQGKVIETGYTNEVIYQPRHPYSRLLLASTPSIGGRTVSSAERRSLRALIEQ